MFSPVFRIALVTEVFKDDDAYASLHDTIFEAIDEDMTEEEAHVIFFNLPDTIQCDALKWGLGDTEVRDQIYIHLKKQEKDNG